MKGDLSRLYAEKSARAYCALKERVLKELVPVGFHDPAKFEEYASLHDLKFIVDRDKPDEEQLWMDGKRLGTFSKSLVTDDGLRLVHRFIPNV